MRPVPLPAEPDCPKAVATAPPAGAGGPATDAGNALAALIAREIASAGGWLPFDRYMALALYAPGLGYYSRGGAQIGHGPGDGSDFVTAPVLSPLFGATLARAVGPVLAATGTATVVEFGAGTGALAEQLLRALGGAVQRYLIVELSGGLRAAQQRRLAPFAPRVQWLDAWPDAIEGVVLGNEVLDAMPVQLLHWDGAQWWERGVVVAPPAGPSGIADAGAAAVPAFAWADRPTALHPPHPGPYAPGTVTEIHPQAQAFVRTLAARLLRGAALFVDYGFPEAEYYHPQRRTGTLVCHRGHRTETDADAPLREPGTKDITAHVNFSAVALAAQDAGLEVPGYTSQARFLFNLGLGAALEAADVRARAAGLKLVHEHEMGELFKVLALAKGLPEGLAVPGFEAGDRSHTL